jgi:hypothetical protein
MEVLMATLIEMIRRFEELLSAERALARTTRVVDDFNAGGRCAPRSLREEQLRNMRAVEALQIVRTELEEALASYDSSAIDGRLASEITNLEVEALSLYNAFHRAQMRLEKAAALKAAVPLDAQEIVDVVGPKLAAVIDRVTPLYPLRGDRYARIKFFTMLDALKQRGQQKDAPAGTAHIKVIGPERTAKRKRNCRGKKYRTKNAPRPKATKPDNKKQSSQKKAKGKGQAIKRGQRAA